jgi:hypothetical protein
MLPYIAINQAKEYFTNLHDVEVNQWYDKELGLRYSFHLNLAYEQYCKFSHLLETDEELESVGVAIWGHDSMEDARLTYKNLSSEYGAKVADIIYCCTDEKGKNREERKSETFYKELGENELAVYAKLCDMMANIQYSMLSGSNMFAKYKREWETNKMKDNCFIERFETMFDYIDWVFTCPN